MASRCLAMISACQTSPTVMMLIATTQTAMTNVFCVSEAGIRKQRVIQAMVRGLLVLGRYAVDPTRDLPADATMRRAKDMGNSGANLLHVKICPLTSRIRGFQALRPGEGNCFWTSPVQKGSVGRNIFSGETQDFPLTVSIILSQESAEPRSISRNRAGRRSLLG
jgi:hypothetical protein